MTTIYLRAATEADMKAALPFAVTDGEWVTYTHDWAIDLIGPMVVTPAVMGGTVDEPVIVTPAVIDTGFHANLSFLRGFSAEIDTAIIITPANPKRRWA
jgi:hypothetical protein